MDLVRVYLYAEAYYSGAEYKDDIWIKKSSYEKLKNVFPEEISCGDLDGKFSEVMGEVSIQDDWHTDEEYARVGIALCDGCYLENDLERLYEDNGLDWETEQKEIREYFRGLDMWVSITVNIPRSKIQELLDFAEKLKSK